MAYDIQFNHAGINVFFNEDLNIEHDASGAVTAGQATLVHITARNPGTVDGAAHAKIYWGGINAGAPAWAWTLLDGTAITGVAIDADGVVLNQPPVGSHSVTDIVWTPSSVFLNGAAQAHGCLFAQLSMDPYPGQTPVVAADPTNFDPNFQLNAQRERLLCGGGICRAKGYLMRLRRAVGMGLGTVPLA